jgi:hypothetical protein
MADGSAMPNQTWCARAPGALLHAARELVRIGLLGSGESHGVDGRRDAALDLLPGDAAQLQAVGDVVPQVSPGEEPEVLEHHRDAGKRFLDHLAVDADLAIVERRQPAHAAQQRGLAAPGGADDADDLRVAHVEADVGENLERPVAQLRALHRQP